MPFYWVSCFRRKKFINFNKFIVKCEWKKCWNEGNQIHNFISSSGSGTVINYGSGSDILTSYGSVSPSQKVTVPFPLVKKLRFLRFRFRFRFRFHNAADPDPLVRGTDLRIRIHRYQNVTDPQHCWYGVQNHYSKVSRVKHHRKRSETVLLTPKLLGVSKFY